MILVFGSINMDLVARVPAIPRPGETVLAARYETLFGGKGANQAVAAGRACRGTGIAVAMAGCVGDDDFGRAALANLNANGVATDLVRTGAAPTGCAFISVDDRGENAITVAAGANATVAASDLGDEVLARATVVVLQMEVPVVESLTIARRARARGARVVWNLAPAPSSFDGTRSAAILAAGDVLVFNQHEMASFAGALGLEAGSHAAAAAAVARRGGRICVVTAGAAGAVAVWPDGKHCHAAALDVSPVDTTGAGDTFVGVLAAGLAEGAAIDAALGRACYGASLACLALGAQSAMPERVALESWPTKLG